MSTNALERRIRRFVQLLIAEERLKNAEVTFGVKLLFDRHRPLWLRILCTLLIILSSSLFVYQSVDRFMHYLSYPVNVDVNIEEFETINIPEIIIPFPYTREIIDLMTVAEIRSTDSVLCANLLLFLVDRNKTNITSLWTAANTTSIVIKHDVIMGTETREFPMTTKPNPYATAAVFSSREEFSTKGKSISVNIQLSRQNGSCEIRSIPVMFADLDGVVNYENIAFITGSNRIKIGLTLKQYRFLNRRSSPCTEDEETYKNCLKECRLQAYKKLSCNFPFMPLETGLPICRMANTSELVSSKDIFIGIDPQFLACTCVRACSQTFYEFLPVAETKTELGADITLYFINNFVTVTTERQAYDFISFLSDSGGNMGLFLGLSLLDFIHWFHYLATKNLRKNNQHFKLNDPILNIVRKVMNKIIFKNENSTRTTFCQIISVKFVFTSLCALLAFLMIVLRLEYFFRFPTTNVLTVNDSVYVQYPVMTLCWDSKIITARKKYLARKQKHLSDPCKVTLLDLMGPPLYFSAQKIWMLSYNNALSWNRFTHVNLII